MTPSTCSAGIPSTARATPVDRIPRPTGPRMTRMPSPACRGPVAALEHLPRCATTRSTWSCAPAACRSASRASRCACARSSTRRSRCPGIAASSPSRFPRRCGSPRPTTTSSLGYPSVDRAAIAALAADERAAARVTLMVDDLAQLDVVDAVAAPARAAEMRVAIDADASWRAPGLGHIGVHRSPVHEPGRGRQPRARRSPPAPASGSSGLMMYEAQIAGQGDATGSGDAVIRWMQRRSGAASCSSAAPRSSPRCATSPRSSSSTAAGPARSS